MAGEEWMAHELKARGVECIEVGDLQGNIRILGMDEVMRVTIEGPAPWDGWRFLGSVILQDVDEQGRLYYDQCRLRLRPDADVDLTRAQPQRHPMQRYTQEQLREMAVESVSVGVATYSLSLVEAVEIQEEIGMGIVELLGASRDEGEVTLNRRPPTVEETVAFATKRYGDVLRKLEDDPSTNDFTAQDHLDRPDLPWPEQIIETVACRGSAYGTPSTNHQLTADLWSAWMSRRLKVDIKFSAEDVCMLNILQKASRLAERTKDDSWIDVMGYSENVSRLRPEQRNTT